MQAAFDRTKALIGEQSFNRLCCAKVLVIGVGGVGGAAVEVLARAGVGNMTLVDGDRFEPTNLNRQILCTEQNIGEYKAEQAKKRVSEINAQACVTAVNEFITSENIDGILNGGYTFCIDAIDDVRNKTALICACKAQNIPIASAMGAGNRVDCEFAVTDIYKTKDDPLARKLRHELRARGVKSLDVVCAVAPPIMRSATPMSCAAPPFVMGAMLANFAVKQIIGGDGS